MTAARRNIARPIPLKRWGVRADTAGARPDARDTTVQGATYN
jgi:hypothetical protein